MIFPVAGKIIKIHDNFGELENIYAERFAAKYIYFFSF
jgi:hypothetical protein